MKKQPPNEVAEVFEALDRDLIWMHVRMQWYKELFHSGSGRLALLDEIASVFFVTLQIILHDDIVLAVSRITDPAEIAGYENMTLDQLVIRLEASGETRLAQKLQADLAALRAHCAPIRERRNKRVAHRDLDRSLRDSKKRLPHVDVQMMESALESISGFINEVSVYYGGPETIYENAGSQSGADTLVEHLKEAAYVRDEFMKDPVFWHEKLAKHKFRDV
jgi:hypothetical protein